MKKAGKILLILLLMMTLIAALVACVDNNDKGDTPVDPPDDNTPPTINTVDVFETMGRGLYNMGQQLDSVKNVTSSYTLRVKTVNISVRFEANYNKDREQDSEYLLQIFDNNFEKTVAFIYYTKGSLYYKLQDTKREIVDFGGQSIFPTFVRTMKMFDIGSFLAGDSFRDMFSDMGYLTDARNMTQYRISETTTSTTARYINLDDIKTSVNETIRDGFGMVGTRLDALSEYLIGFRLSALAEVEVGQLTVDELRVIQANTAVTDFNIKFQGMQSNNIEDYLVDMKYAVKKDYGTIAPGKYEDPDTNAYPEKPEGNYHYAGTIYVPFLDTQFSFGMRAVLDIANNDRNNVIFEIVNKQGGALDPNDPHYINDEVVMIYYLDEVLYVDIDGLMENYIRNGVKLQEMNFPRVRFEGINLSQELNSALTYLLDFVENDFDESILENLWDENSRLRAVLEKIESDGSQIKFTLDEELIREVLGAQADGIAEWIAARFGIPVGTVNAILGAGGMENITLELTYDTKTGVVGVYAYHGGELLFRIEMTAQDMDADGVDMTLPESFDYTHFRDFNAPQAVNMHLEGELTLQDSDAVDFSKLMGVFIGDVTGVNSPLDFTINDIMKVSMDVWQQNELVNVQGVISLNDERLIELYASQSNTDYYLVNNLMYGVKYRIPRAGLSEALQDLLGEDSLFQEQTVIDIFRVLIGDSNVVLSDDSLDFSLAKYRNEDGEEVDPLLKLVGIPNLIGRMSTQIFFKNPDITVLERDYRDPEIAELPDRMYESMYEAKWHDTVDVAFRDNNNNTVTKTFKLSFIGESAVLQSNRYFYTPEAKLFGQGVSYQMTLTDTVNGTKLVEKLVTYESYVDENGEEKVRIVDLNKLSLDPSEETPFPERLLVEYDDSAIGRLAYEIEGFPYNADNIGDRLMGLRPAKYKIYIGKGSIAEKVFEIDVEILNRVIQVADDAYIGNVPIVSTVNIDPYDYSVKKQQDPDYSPIPADLDLTFGSNLDENAVTRYTAKEFEWDYAGSGFAVSDISYSGGNYFVYGYFNRLKVAMNVIVAGKNASHIQIVGEKIGEYTVDSLVRETYTIPTISTDDIQIRIYFETGRYRIVGEEPENYVETDGNCDGFYPYPLRWTYPVANINTLDRVLNPLNNGQTRTNTAPFGDSLVGTQEMRLTVVCPSRRVREMANSELVITEFMLDQDGNVIEEGTVISAEKISAVGFGDTDGTAFEFDPYEKDAAKRRLPSVVYMNVEAAGNTVRKAYPVTWHASTIIDGNGVILHPRAEDCLLLAVGTIGDVIPQNIYMMIHNRSGEFEAVEMKNPVTNQAILPDAEGKYYLEVNQYENFRLPESFTLTFSAASGIAPQTYSTDWVYVDASGETHRLADGYRFPYTGGTFEVVTYVAADNEQGILAQEVRLQLQMQRRRILEDRVLGLWSDMDNERMETVTADDGSLLRFVTVDGYSDESGTFLSALQNGIANVGVFFPDLNEQVNGIPVTFDNAEELISALQSPRGTSDTTVYPHGFVTLRGKVYRGTALEQDLALNFKVVSRVLRSISFLNLSDEFVESETVAIDSVISEGHNSLTIHLLKPYRLEGRYTTAEGTDAYGLVTPSQYLNYLFGSVKLAFEGDVGGDYAIPLQLPEDFDSKVFDPTRPAGDNVYVQFVLDRLSYGSTGDTFTVTVVTKQDAMAMLSATVNVETFNENGTPKYSNGYEVQKNADVEYLNSGVVVYTGLEWKASGTYVSVDGTERIRDGEVVESVSNTFFNTMAGNTINLTTTLFNGNVFNLILRFYRKDIQKVNYNASAEDANYNITAGTITVDNVYQVYPFDPQKIPQIITPYTTASNAYVQGIGEKISFTVQWTPSQDFADEAGGFDPQKINALINSMGYTKSLLATAHIPGHTGESGQTVELYIEVRALNHMAITHEKLNIVGNHLTLDPYRDNFGGAFVLPKDISVNFYDEDIGNIDYRFGIDDNVTYEINKGGVWVPIELIPYNHLGHELGAEFGNATDVLSLRVTLPDGKNGELEVQFLSRELTNVFLQNRVTKQAEEEITGLLDKKYYIDPYHAATFTVPKEVILQFKEGADITMKIDWAIGTAPFALTADGYRLTVDASTYSGAEYLFGGSLVGYGVAEQPFEIEVIVLNRSVTDTYFATQKTYTFTNPISGLVSDLNVGLPAPSFVSLSANPIYADYIAIADPVTPVVVWDLLDDDIVYSGIESRRVNGVLTYDGVRGQTTDVLISAPRVEFVELQGVVDNIIDFNPYTSESVYTGFKAVMSVNGVLTDYDFYSETANVSDNQRRMLIRWGEHNNATDELKTFTLGNAFKSIVIPVEKKYRYNYQQIVIEKIDFGFNGGEGAYSGQVNAVIDPLNPAVPTTAQAWGRITGSNEVTGPMTVNVRWNESVYDMPMFGGSKQVTAYLTAVDAPDEESIFTIQVHYLDRTPIAFYTTESAFSTGGSQGGSYPLAMPNAQGMRVGYFEIDPIDNRLYNPEDGTYRMPSTVRVTFKTDYSDAFMQTALGMYGMELFFTEIEWGLSRPVELFGATEEDPIIAKMLKFRLQYVAGGNTVVSEPYDYSNGGFATEFDLDMTVTDREVMSTDISYRIVPEDGSASYQMAFDSFYIDLYAVYFPDSVQIVFKGEDLPRNYSGISWEYDKEFLEKPEVISGLIAEKNPDALNLRATIKVYGAELHVMFPIKPRNIDISTGVGDATRPLRGGKIYVLKDIPLRQQLPTQLYYKFTYQGNLDVSAVPLEWPSTVDTTISTARAGVVYTDIAANLGSVDKGNVMFDIEVIDPVLYNVVETVNEYGLASYRNGSTKYNYVTVARDYNNYYIEGRESVVLPKRVLVNDNNEYLEIERVEYDITAEVATFHCKYTFLSVSDSPDLSGNENGMDEDSMKLSISFTLPLRSYDYTDVDLEYYFNVKEYHVPLGVTIETKDLPRVYDEDGKELELIWDMSNVDTRRAGEYTADGYYRNAYGQNVLKTLKVVVDQREFTADDVTLAREWLVRPYSGKELPIANYLTIADFLRMDGTYGQVQNYVVEYSLDGGYNWQSAQPVQVQLEDLPAYLVRITIEDYNVYGAVEFTLNITKQLITEDSVNIIKSESEPYGRMEYEYDGTEHFPYVAGLPEGATYRMVFNGNANIRPLNAGSYSIRVSFPDQRNFISQMEFLESSMVITKKSVNYDVMSELTYNGAYRHAEIVGLPEDLGDIRVEYRYTHLDTGRELPAGSMVREAGHYKVTVSIYGGINYPDALNTGANRYDNLRDREFTIVPKRVVLKVNRVESEYLSELKPLNSSVTFADAEDESLPGLVGTDTMAIFREIGVYWPEGTLSYKHMVGEYVLKAEETVEHNNYTVVRYDEGVYAITATAANVRVIENKADLDARLALLQDGDTVRWYLRAGNYGDIVLDKNASVSIVGSYNLTADTEEIAVHFDSVTILRGAVLLDIVSMQATANKALVSVGADAGSVTVNRSEFVPRGSSVLLNSVAIRADSGYRNVLYMEGTSIQRFTRAVDMKGGSVNLRGCTFTENTSAVYVENGNVTLTENAFLYTRGDAVYIAGAGLSELETSIVDNRFIGNVVAIRTFHALHGEVTLQNEFDRNASDLIKLD